MKRVRPDFYNEFHCIADSCTITRIIIQNLPAPQTNVQSPAVRNGKLLWIRTQTGNGKKFLPPLMYRNKKRISVPIQKKKTVSGSFSLTQTIAAPFFPRTDFAGLLLLTVIKSCPKPVLRFQEKFTGFPVISRKR